jgi:type II secretory pathway pseudopilin PulG
MMLVALIIKLIWWILGAAALYLLFRVVRSQLRLAQARRQAGERRAALTVARADRQHRWVLSGDPRGIYGDYPVPDLFDGRRKSQLL